MPVLRKRESVQVQQGPTGVIKGRQNPALQNAWAMSDMMSNEAAKYGRLMANEAEQKAIGLARNAVFSQDENGTPQMPDDPTKTWGRIGQRVYDDNVKARYADRLAISVKAHVEAAKNEFPYDLEAFQANVNDRLDGMQSSVPNEFGGLFQDIVSDMKTTAGAQIGRSQGALMEVEEKQVAAARNDIVMQHIGQLIQSGETEAAQAVMGDAFARIDGYAPHILNDYEKYAMKEGLILHQGVQRLIVDQDVMGMNAGQLAGLIADLNLSNPDLIDYFRMEGAVVPSPDLMRRAAAQLNIFYATANASAGAQGAVYNMQAWARGESEDTTQNRVIGDAVVADQIGHVDENGMRATLGATDWLDLSPQDMARAVQTVKTGGMLPASLHALGNMVERGSITDEESLEQAYDIWVALKEAPNRAGERRDMTVKFGGDNTRRIFTLATALVDNGSHGDTPLQEAAGLISSLSGQEWTDLTLATAMRRITGDDVSEDDARSVMSSRVIKKLSEGDHAFNGVDPADEEIAEAEMLYETFIRLGESEKDVLNMVDQSLEGRWAETDVMLGVSRSAYDPNIRYAAPQAVSARESFGNFFDAIGGGILKEAELTNTLISEMFTLGFFKGETDWGADALLAAPWEFAADSLIREHFENNMSEEDQTDFWSTMGYTGQAIDGTGQLVDVGDGTRKSPLRAGEHYKLIPDTAGSTDRPLYRVFVMNAQSNRMTEVPDFRLDLRPAMAQMQKNFNDFNENMARLKQEVAKNAPASVEDFLKLAEKFGIREGYTTPSDLIREGYGN